MMNSQSFIICERKYFLLDLRKQNVFINRVKLFLILFHLFDHINVMT